MSESMKVDVIEENGLAVVRLAGAVGLAVASLDHEFIKITVGRPQVVIVDMTDVTFVSSLGMSLFVNLRNTINRLDGRLFVFGARPAILDAFHRARLDSLFEVRATLADALESAGRPLPAALADGSTT